MELREWQYMNKPASNSSGSSKTNKNKFITLMYNMMKNKLPSVTDAKCIRVDDSGFTYKETRNNATLGEHTLTLLVGYNKDNSWKYELYIDTTLAESQQGNGMEELIHWLSSYFSVPNKGTKEYNSLCEWVAMKNTSNNSSQATKASSNNSIDHVYRYKRLLAQIDADGFCKYHVNLLNDRILAFTLNNGVGVKIIYKPYVPGYLVQVDGYDTVCDDYEDVLKLLIIEGIIGDTDLCESASIADDFKTYENLWEGTEEKEYYRVLGRTKYNLFDDSDLDAYLTQSAKLMRKPATNQKSMEEYKLNKIKFLLYNLKGTGAPAELIQKVQAVQNELEKKLN